MALDLKAAILLTGVTFAGVLSAQPITLTEAQFAAQTSTLPTIIETFDGFAIGNRSSPMSLANATYTAVSPHIEFGAWCPLSNCLGETGSIASERTFSAFPQGTTFWGSRVLYASVGQVVRVTVIGNGGSLVLDLPPSPSTFVPSGHFFGASDPSGIVSVSFRELGGVVNYSIDNVVTATVSSAGPVVSATGVPALDVGMLFGLVLFVAVASMPVLRRRHPWKKAS